MLNAALYGVIFGGALLLFGLLARAFFELLGWLQRRRELRLAVDTTPPPPPPVVGRAKPVRRIDAPGDSAVEAAGVMDLTPEQREQVLTDLNALWNTPPAPSKPAREG